MTKDEFIGYLHAMKDVYEVEEDFEEDFLYIMDKIIEKANTLPITATTYPIYPTYPINPTYPTNPSWQNPWITYTSNNSRLDNLEEFEYNGIKIKKDPLVGPNDWEVKCDTAPNFTVVK